MNIGLLLIVIIVLLVIIMCTGFILIVRQKIFCDAMLEVFDEKDKRNMLKHTDIATLLEEENYDEALSFINARLDKDKDNKFLNWYLCHATYNLKMWKDSKKAILKTIQIEPLYKKELDPYLEIIEGEFSGDV